MRQADGEDFAAAARVGGVAAAAAAVVFDRLLAVPELPDVATRPAVGQSHQLERHAQVAQSGHARTDPQVAGEQNQRVDPLFGTKKTMAEQKFTVETLRNPWRNVLCLTKTTSSPSPFSVGPVEARKICLLPAKAETSNASSSVCVSFRHLIHLYRDLFFSGMMSLDHIWIRLF